MDRAALLAALAALRARGDVAGWVAGSGFEAQLELLAEAAGVLPLLGNSPETVRRARSPAAFADLLDALGCRCATRGGIASLFCPPVFLNACKGARDVTLAIDDVASIYDNSGNLGDAETPGIGHALIGVG